MILEKGQIPPNANFERLNPQIDAELWNIEVRASHNDMFVTCEIDLASFPRKRFLGLRLVFEEHRSIPSAMAGQTLTRCLMMLTTS